MTKKEVAVEDESLTTLRKYLEDLQNAHLNLVGICHVIGERIKRNELAEELLCDVGGTLKSLQDLFDECRKEAKAKSEMAGKVIGVMASMKAVEEPGVDSTVRGQYYTGTPDVKLRPKVPKTGSPEYEEMLRYFSIPEATIKDAMLGVNFSEMTIVLTRLAAAGRPVPPGLGTYKEYVTTFRKKKT